MNDQKDLKHNPDANPDPITGQPGAHPVGTGVGAAGVGLAGTAVGAAVGGPVGAAIGAVVGSVAGGLAGKSVAERIDPTVEDTYWRNNYQSRPYFERGYDYDYYRPAYEVGYNSYATYGLNQGMTYEQAEPHLRSEYERNHGNGGLGWEKAKHPVRDAWNRVKDAVSNDNYADRTHRTY